MDGLRTPSVEEETAAKECSRCRATGCPWDRIGGLAMCPDCQELLILGEGEPLRMASEARHCSACGAAGTVSFVTVPLRARSVVIDLCPGHLRALLMRGLDRAAFLELARQLQACGLAPGRVFLLHEAFYDRQGRALQPVGDAA
jgi:hypothetical protein